MGETAVPVEMVMGSNMMLINGYTAAKGIGVGEYVASNEFAVGGYRWAVYFYPYGKTSAATHNSDYVSMYVAVLDRVAGDDRVPAYFELTLIDQTGKGKHKLHTCFDKPPPRQVEHVWGFPKFFRRELLDKSKYLRDDCLKFYCTVGVLSASASASGIDREMVERPIPMPVPSCSVIETWCGSNLFEIQGYTLSKCLGEGQLTESNEFLSGGYKWKICFSPNARMHWNDPSHRVVSVFVKLASEGKDVQAMIELTLMDQSGKGKHKVLSSSDRALMFTSRGGMWRFKIFSASAMLEASDYLRDDCLKIHCTIGVVASTIDCSRFSTICVPDSDIGSHIGMLLENMEGFDLTFDVCGEKIHAHKLILAARLPKLVEGVMTEEVMVPDMEPRVFKAMLHFIYTDALAENEAISSATSIADTLTAKLLAAADRYGLERLKVMCESHLCKFVAVNSATGLLALADQYHAAQLKDVCLQFAPSNVTGVRGWDGLDEENCASVKCDGMNSDEDISNGDSSSSRRVRKRSLAEMVLKDFESLRIFS